MEARYVQRGEAVDFVPDADLKAGDVKFLGALAAVAKLDAKAGDRAALATTGIYDVAKGQEAFAIGDAVHWDGAKATKSADDGAEGNAKKTYASLGVCVLASDADDATVRVLINA